MLLLGEATVVWLSSYSFLHGTNFTVFTIQEMLFIIQKPVAYIDANC